MNYARADSVESITFVQKVKTMGFRDRLSKIQSAKSKKVFDIIRLLKAVGQILSKTFIVMYK